jgi:circadian clock protein KaiB
MFMDEGNTNITDWKEKNENIYILRLFVTGASSTSARAINNLQSILEEHLKSRYKLEIIDVHQQPLLVKNEDITAVPVLIKKIPLPLRKLVGDMSDKNRVLRGLGLI